MCSRSHPAFRAPHPPCCCPLSAADEDNACDVNRISSPDNVDYMEESDTIIIGEVGLAASGASRLHGAVAGQRHKQATCLPCVSGALNTVSFSNQSSSTPPPPHPPTPPPPPHTRTYKPTLQDTSDHLSNVMWAYGALLAAAACPCLAAFCIPATMLLSNLAYAAALPTPFSSPFDMQT
jgi:hypothetical protein